MAKEARRQADEFKATYGQTAKGFEKVCPFTSRWAILNTGGNSIAVSHLSLAPPFFPLLCLSYTLSLPIVSDFPTCWSIPDVLHPIKLQKEWDVPGVFHTEFPNLSFLTCWSTPQPPFKAFLFLYFFHSHSEVVRLLKKHNTNSGRKLLAFVIHSQLFNMRWNVAEFNSIYDYSSSPYATEVAHVEEKIRK